MERMSTFMGYPVIESPYATRNPTPGEDARRIVRHGMADVLRWLREPVGPAPGDPVPTAFLLERSRLVAAHPDIVRRLRQVPR